MKLRGAIVPDSSWTGEPTRISAWCLGEADAPPCDITSLYGVFMGSMSILSALQDDLYSPMLWFM